MKPAFTIPVFGGIPVASSVVVTWIIMVVWIILTLLATRNLKVRNPGKVQVVLESAVNFLNGFVKDTHRPPLAAVRPLSGHRGTVHWVCKHHRHFRSDLPHQGCERHRGPWH